MLSAPIRYGGHTITYDNDLSVTIVAHTHDFWFKQVNSLVFDLIALVSEMPSAAAPMQLLTLITKLFISPSMMELD